MDILQIFTKPKAEAIAKKIAQGLEEHKITGTTNIIAYALRESCWLDLKRAGSIPSRVLKTVKGPNSSSAFRECPMLGPW